MLPAAWLAGKASEIKLGVRYDFFLRGAVG